MENFHIVAAQVRKELNDHIKKNISFVCDPRGKMDVSCVKCVDLGRSYKRSHFNISNFPPFCALAPFKYAEVSTLYAYANFILDLLV